MREPRRVLFVSQEISPYLADETPIRLFNRRLPQACQEAGIETRTFMPKYGDINERKNQLHEVIRLSGINIIIAESDHPLLLKVASIQSARIQIYFIDNDDYFRKRKGVAYDETGTEHPDNDERCIFFARGTLETVQKMSWFPGIVQCSGWMTALVPLYIHTAYHDTPFFGKSKVVVGLTEERFDTPFGTDFAQKLRFEGVSRDTVAHLYEKEVDYITLMKLAIDHADAVAIQSPNADPELIAYAREKGIEIWDFSDGNVADCVEAYKQFDNVTN